MSDYSSNTSIVMLYLLRSIGAGVPGGLVSGPRAYQDQFRGFKSLRVHARKGFFLH